MENKEPEEATAKSSLGLLIVEGGFDDQVCLSPHSKWIVTNNTLGWRVGVVP
jgi:hypothetical protein